MRELLGQLRVRFAVVGFVAIYSPVVVLLGVLAVTGVAVSEEVNLSETGVREQRTTSATLDWPALLVTAVVLAAATAWVAWWLAGRAVRPAQQAAALQEELLEELSHELRTPLAVLSTNADVLLDHPDPTTELYRGGLERSRAAAARMTTTVERLLVDARNRSRTVHRRPTDVAELVGRIVTELQPLAASRQVEIERNGARSVTASIDQPSVERALTNLVTNALEASPPGSVVTVEVAPSHGSVVISVADEGPGIPEADQSKIFDRYWQGEHGGAARGDGIGLSIVRHVATAHGGDITVRSPIGSDRDGGCEFRFEIDR